MDVKGEILKQLDVHRGKYLSGETLSAGLGVTRQAVWKAIKKLISEGYIIDSVTNKGYMLDGKCDLLSALIISERTGANVFCFDEVSSTNTVAMQKLKDGCECIVVAERQTFGRAKDGAIFASPQSKGIYMSVGLKYNLPLEKIQALREQCAKNIALVLADCCGTMPEIFNIDELFINRKKVCGILWEGEVNLSSKTISSLVIGIGVYTAEVSEKLGYITASEPRNALVCSIYNCIKEILK